ncbi:MAG: MFS transporter [Planctomycetota bacterium]|nr:MFS transporter [Planctomycetota bacterium]
MSQNHATSLKSKTYLGLILAQFTATFNDQAIHMVAVFYAVDMLVRFAKLPHVDEKAVVSIVTACFITPFLLFSSFAGMVGDRYSKRNIIVFWKVAEVGMMGLALFGLALPHFVGVDSPNIWTVSVWSAGLVVATVFLMGMHSTFFVPAKLGVMPEIIHPSILSQANGILEGTSFMAQILGTSFGGMLYALLKGEVIPGNPTRLVLGQEWIIGVVLLLLAVVGTGTSLLMRPVAAAAPERKLSWNWWTPLRTNIGIVLRSKPLTLSSTGIAFCVFMTLFLRQTLLLQGEMVKELNTAKTELAAVEGRQLASEEDPEADGDPIEAAVEMKSWMPPRLVHALREPELRVSMLFVLVGLGVGVGSLCAGFLSGHRVELGLVPIGGLLIIICTLIPGFTLLQHPKLFGFCLFGIGFGAGFYLVPMYTLLQQRAPKASKGNVIAASNFINVSGGVISVLVFFAVAWLLEKFYGARLTETTAIGDPALLRRRVGELETQFIIPRLLYLTATLFTIAALILLVRKLPDFVLRSMIWLREWCHNRLRAVALDRLPLDGPVVLLTNCSNFQSVLDLTAALDRHAHVILAASPSQWEGMPLMRRLAIGSGTTLLSLPAQGDDWARATAIGERVLQEGGMIAVNLGDGSDDADRRAMLEALRKSTNAVWLPVFSTAGTVSNEANKKHPRIVFGEAIASGLAIADMRSKIAELESYQPPEPGGVPEIASVH